MKDYKELFSEGRYGDLANSSSPIENGEEALYRVSALLADSRPQEARDCFLANRDLIYEFSPLRCLKANLEIRFLLEEFDEAYDDESYYQEKPYVNQRMEEQLRDYHKGVREEEKKSLIQKKISDGEVDVLIKEAKNDREILAILGGIKGKLSPESQTAVRGIVASSSHDLLRTYALLLLVGDKDEEEILFCKNGKEYRLVPARMTPPFMGKEHSVFMTELESLGQDVSKRDLASHLYSDYILYLYPETPYGEKGLASSFLEVASLYLGEKLEKESPLTKKIMGSLASIKPL